MFETFMNKRYYDGRFAGEYTQEFEHEVSRLLALVNHEGSPPTIAERVQMIEALFDAYIDQTKVVPEGAQVQRLANWLLLEYLRDNHPDKVTREEYPFLTKRQLRTRYNRELADENITEKYTRQKYLGGAKQPTFKKQD